MNNHKSSVPNMISNDNIEGSNNPSNNRDIPSTNDVASPYNTTRSMFSRAARNTANHVNQSQICDITLTSALSLHNFPSVCNGSSDRLVSNRAMSEPPRTMSESRENPVSASRERMRFLSSVLDEAIQLNNDFFLSEISHYLPTQGPVIEPNAGRHLPQ
jgi:hypothetical protein